MTASLHRCLLTAMVVIVVVWSALAASAAAHPLTPVPSAACAFTAPPRAVPDLAPRYSTSQFDQGKLVRWDVGDSTGHVVGFRYDVYRVGATWPGPHDVVIAHGADWVAWTTLRVGTNKVQFTVTDCLGRSDTAVVFVEVVDDRS